MVLEKKIKEVFEATTIDAFSRLVLLPLHTPASWWFRPGMQRTLRDAVDGTAPAFMLLCSDTHRW